MRGAGGRGRGRRGKGGKKHAMGKGREGGREGGREEEKEAEAEAQQEKKGGRAGGREGYQNENGILYRHGLCCLWGWVCFLSLIHI